MPKKKTPACTPAPVSVSVPDSAPDPAAAHAAAPLIRLRGARQHNLKNLDVDIRTGEMTVVTGLSVGQQQRAAVARALIGSPELQKKQK